MKHLWWIVLLCLLALGAPAQGPLWPGASAHGALVATEHGLFVLRAGTLARMDPQQLTPALPPLELFGPMPEPPQGNDPAAWQAYAKAQLLRLTPGVLIPCHEDLLVVIGEHFARIDQQTFEVKVGVSFAREGAAPEAPRLASPPLYHLDGDTLYLLRDTEMLAINIQDGRLHNRAPLPPALQGRAMGRP